MRITLVCALVLAVGCGGSGSGATLSASAQLAGTVYEVDGQSSDLAGVQVTLKETGERSWTDAGGSFAFDGLAPGVYTLGFEGDGTLVAGGDEFADGAGAPRVDVPAGAVVQIRVALQSGEVSHFSSECSKGQSATAKLESTEDAASEGYEVCGVIKIAQSDEGTLFKVCVKGLTEGDEIEVYVDDTSIGTATADEDGRACVALEDELPLDATDLSELAGLGVSVYLTSADPQLELVAGEVPDISSSDDGDGDDDGYDGDKDGHHGDEDCDEDEDGDGGDATTDGDGTSAESKNGDGDWHEGTDEDKDQGDCDEDADGDGTDGDGGTDGGDSGTEAT
ncbi:MAG TPA: carboxypeptidase-like regulatory domain-containing protein [Planctomycetota bacterium]|nr:carboxypeptidase-like regulatory domain-containing protein [Planctomycetota bacterium]